MTPEYRVPVQLPKEDSDNWQRCVDNLGEIGNYRPDFIHGEWHLSGMRTFAHWATAALRLDTNQSRWLFQGVDYHDTGYSFVDAGVIPPEQHHVGSAVNAWLATHDPELTWGVLLHNAEVLPDYTPLWVRLLRDFDRLEHSGWKALLLEAYYQGFRHPVLEPHSYQLNFEGKLMYQHPLADTRLPDEINYTYEVKHSSRFYPTYHWTWTDYEQRLAAFCRTQVFPYLLEHDLIRATIDKLWLWLSRMYGEEADDNEEMEIDMICPEFGIYESAKRFNLEQAIAELYGYEGKMRGVGDELRRWTEPQTGQMTEVSLPLLLTLQHIVSREDLLELMHRIDTGHGEPFINHEIQVKFD